MRLLKKSGIAFLSIILSMLPFSLFAATPVATFLGSISQPLSLWPYLFLLLGAGIWFAMQDGKCVHKLLAFILGGYLLGMLFGGLIPHMIFGVSVIALLLIAVGIMIISELKLHDIASMLLVLLIGFFSAQGALTMQFSLMHLVAFIGLLIGVFLGVSAGYGAHALLKKLYNGKLILLMGIVIALVGLLKLFALM